MAPPGDPHRVVALLAMPGEPFIEIGQQMVKASLFPDTLFSG